MSKSGDEERMPSSTAHQSSRSPGAPSGRHSIRASRASSRRSRRRAVSSELAQDRQLGDYWWGRGRCEQFVGVREEVAEPCLASRRNPSCPQHVGDVVEQSGELLVYPVHLIQGLILDWRSVGIGAMPRCGHQQAGQRVEVQHDLRCRRG